MSKVAFIVVSALLLSTGAAAQPRESGSALERAGATRADVLLHLGDEPLPLRGLLLSVSRELVLLDADGLTHVIPLDRIDRVDRVGDSPLDGAVLGGAILGGLCIWTCRLGATSARHHRTLVLGNIAIGAILGGLFDHGREGRTTIYRRSQARFGVGVTPDSISFVVLLQKP